MFRSLLLLTLLCAWPTSVAAQRAIEASSAPTLYGRHSLTLQVGLLNRATVETSVASLETRTSGFLGSLTYAYRVKPEWAILVSAGALDVEVRSSVSAAVSSETAVVIPLLFGARYAPVFLTRGPSLRPYVSMAVGPYLGVATFSQVGAVVQNTTTTAAAFGLRTLVGADWLLGAHVKLNIGAGYHFVTDFENPVGLDPNYSGPELTLGFGILFGRGW